MATMVELEEARKEAEKFRKFYERVCDAELALQRAIEALNTQAQMEEVLVQTQGKHAALVAQYAELQVAHAALQAEHTALAESVAAERDTRRAALLDALDAEMTTMREAFLADNARHKAALDAELAEQRATMYAAHQHEQAQLAAAITALHADQTALEAQKAQLEREAWEMREAVRVAEVQLEQMRAQVRTLQTGVVALLGEDV